MLPSLFELCLGFGTLRLWRARVRQFRQFGQGGAPNITTTTSAKTLGVFEVFRVLVTGGLFRHAEGRGPLSRVRAFDPTCPEPGLY